MPAPNRATTIDQFSRNAEQMENRSWFYEGLLAVWERLKVSPEVTICDVGCGTGALLARLQARGYRHLNGTDFAPNCVVATQQAVPEAEVFVHDIEQAPLPRRFDVLTLTTVIDFVADPVAALRHLRASLQPDGLALITIRNREAYWPWYHLRGLAHRLPSARLRHWFLWLTTPLGLQRNWPHERVYSRAEARRLLRAGGLAIRAEHGFQCLPMLWIPEWSRWIRVMQWVDRRSQALPGRARYYGYVFVCGADQGDPV